MNILAFIVFVPLPVHRSFPLSGPRCHIREKSLWDCSRQNLSKIPAAPSEHVAGLDVSRNRLETIAKEDFLAYASLRSLTVANNKIETIQEQAFVPLANLEKLDLSVNSLATLSAGWFKNLLSLRYLNLWGNKYETLGEGNLFQPLDKLKTLHFGGPHLVSVGRSDFSGLSGLRELFFDGTNLQNYAEGSLRHVGPVSHVTLALNGPCERDQALVEVVLSDAVRPNTTLTVTDTLLYTKSQALPFKVAYDGGATGFIFKKVTMTSAACMAFLHLLPGSGITTLTLEDSRFLLYPLGGIAPAPDTGPLEALVLKNVDVPQFYNFPALYFLSPLLRAVRRASVVNCKVYAIPCESSADLSGLEYLDISDNSFSDIALSQMMCGGKGVLPRLRTLNVSRNHLRSINSRIFAELGRLTSIDLSGNAFGDMPETCDWPPSLRFLNLSATHLTRATACLPGSLHILDLSDNELTVFHIGLPVLTELYISGNKISMLPDGGLYPRLVSISIQSNNLQTFSRRSLSDYVALRRLEAAAETFVCSCDFVAFMASDWAKRRVRLGDEVKSYVCESPDAARGTSVADVRLSAFECHAVLSLSLLCSGVAAALLLTAGLCHRFSVVWYAEMTWAWLSAKRKPKLRRGELEYDAFVSFSEMDSGWVEAHLVPELEQSEPPLRLCLHKRDFVPGAWILDNIMGAIERSHKTLFVLSQHFVRSEWCKYELDYTHFRLFDQNDDTVVLILLEPIDKRAVPKKFCRLRRVMHSRTYLEWPDDDSQIAGFWQSLRAAIKRPVTDGS
ncbi:putative toll-like receptor 2 [Scophthalmus maximus]|uniref:Toll-like receptor 2 n=1 Tax=Scophthalmus maximus TaxID=52904 RepID=A0A2U9BMR0_SCOMX|nr:putative toll-like receptor 2 [Scophthalmus maximus]